MTQDFAHGLALRLFPFLRWWPQVDSTTLRSDLLAALTGAVVVLPQGVAFASIAGMPLEYGLYAGMVPAIIAALFGSSRHLVSGPTTAASIVLFSALSVYAEPGSADYVTLALTMTLMVGVLELVLGLVRMGALVNFISHSVIVGFTAGAAILIAAKQLKNFFGVEMPRGGHLHEILYHFWQQIPSINPYVLSVAVITLLSGLAVKRWFPRFPYMIAAMLAGGLTAAWLNQLFGADVTAIKTVGALPQSLPPLSSPDLSFQTIRDLAPSALAVTLFALTEAVSIGRSIAARSGDRIDGNQEFIGQGLSNIVGSFFSGYVATGSFNRSGLNYQSGAKTPLAAVFAGLLLVVIVLLVAPYADWLPNAAMAGILFMVAWGLIDFKEIRHILKGSRRETAVMVVTFLGALFLELELAIFAGILLSLVLYLERVSRPRIVSRAPNPMLYKNAFSSDPGLPQCPQLKILRIDGSLFFGSINHVQDEFERIREQSPAQTHLAIVANGINFVDISGAQALADEARKRKGMGGEFYMIHVKQGLWDALERFGALDVINPNHIFQSKTDSIRAIYQKLNREICRGCDKRIFRECNDVSK
ncbi:SulP family inorganic anion transporter [Candidatus Endoriftia persephone]|jgi:SulP family sulfate permease|uniref:Sulfate transporter n=3 Tax=Gammaproteobacteria TaxID=1236 RepID=G2D9P2_9GAMM|nr:SulP family inorganic anion transporter [Candidatus Endoriftia persephone]EGV52704.1 sulfate transporter [endosymbiont of Riftia pachyptila (vent Ph05)]EGW55689.1 putative sulfate transporter YvdB [endosymbiont of Tevnia jerichonana (vent Tica)]USF86322.1 SulP family inorganic anion transporter [Candidatus Endoriftia persephone]